jgi:hypothetical protein
MVASLYWPCGPRPASNDAARWYNPCLRRMAILFTWPGISTTDAVMEISCLGDTIKLHYDGGTTTQSTCTAPTGRLSIGSGSASQLPVVLDLWNALDAAEWSSSFSFNVLCSHDYSLNQNSRLSFYMYGSGGSYSGIGNSALKNTYQAAPITCSTSPAGSFSVTVYDDGTYTVS